LSKQHAHFQASPGRREIFLIVDERNGLLRGGVHFLRTHSLFSHALNLTAVTAATKFSPEASEAENGMPPEAFENRRHHGAKTNKAARAAECRIVTRRSVTARYW